jgi:excisionase family DNA binding protein
MTVREISAYLRVHPSTIYKLLHRGELPGFRIGTDWRFNAEVIDRWCLERNMKPVDAVPPSTRLSSQAYIPGKRTGFVASNKTANGRALNSRVKLAPVGQ